MIELREWFRRQPLPARPWLMLGKGPSFSRVREVDLGRYNVLALNHVVRELKVDVAHFVDVEALRDCADAVVANAEWLLMPYRPHFDFNPTPAALPDLVGSVPVLGEFEKRQRLVWYNLSTSPPCSDSPVVQASYFVSEAVVALLGILGVKVIRTLGVDGGTAYAPAFADIAEKSRLANGVASYDLQFDGIRRAAEEHGLDFAPLLDGVRVFVGTDETQIVPARVLEYTLRKHTRSPIEVTYLDGVRLPSPRDPANRPRTGFSFQRFAIPELCGYRGRAVYLDADMLVFGDIAELWEQPLGRHAVLCTRQDEPPSVWEGFEWFRPGPQMSVLLLDCARLPWDVEAIVRGLDERRYTYAQLLFDLCIVPSEALRDTLPTEWNHLERFEPGRTRLLHYTVGPVQPWRSEENPLGWLWRSAYEEAVAAGAVPLEEVRTGVARGFLKPSLAAALSAVAPGR